MISSCSVTKSLKYFPLQVVYYEEILLSNPMIDFTFFYWDKFVFVSDNQPWKLKTIYTQEGTVHFPLGVPHNRNEKPCCRVNDSVLLQFSSFKHQCSFTSVADSCSFGSRWCCFILYSGYQSDTDNALINVYFTS